MDPIIILIGSVLVAVFVLFLKLHFGSSVNHSPIEQVQDPHIQYVSKDLYSAVTAQLEMAKIELQDKELEVRGLSGQLAARDQHISHLETSLERGKSQNNGLQEQLRTEFENIANKLLEEKGRSLSDSSHRQLQGVLLPLRERIQDFESNIEKKFLEETREKASLKKEIEQLHQLNVQLSADAHNLTSALKGSNKIQGNWGEYQLEMLLEKAGLTKGLHFMAQNSFRDESGRLKRPDFIIQLPENRQLIIDAKVSLTAFERYFNDADPLQREAHLKDHITSIRQHIKNLGSKEYQLLSDLNTTDYTLLFVPIEGALTVAAQADPRLFTDALESNVVLVSTGSLLTTMRTVSHIWKQEKQAHSVVEIARQSGLLYDKFVAFVEDLRIVGTRMDSARNAYDSALNKLVNSPRYGDTLVGRAEKIRSLGARTSKELPSDMTDMGENE